MVLGDVHSCNNVAPTYFLPICFIGHFSDVLCRSYKVHSPILVQSDVEWRSEKL